NRMIVRGVPGKGLDNSAIMAFCALRDMRNRDTGAAYSSISRVDFSDLLNPRNFNGSEKRDCYYQLSKGLFHVLMNLSAIPRYSRLYDSAFKVLQGLPDRFERRNALIAAIDTL